MSLWLLDPSDRRCIVFNPDVPIYYHRGAALTAKCKKCGMEFEDKDRLERHKKVHGRKSKVSEAGGMDFNQVGV